MPSPAAAVLVEQLVQRRDVPDRLGHLLAGALDHPVVHPQLRQLLPARRAGLGGLVLVVGKHQIRAAAVDVEADAEQTLGHRRALDVPARAPLPPGSIPPGVLALLPSLPQREVERILLTVGGWMSSQ